MQARRIETWVWVLVYAGMGLLGLGLAVQRVEVVAGWWMVAGGSVLIALGVLLIWLRSRMKDQA